jgi:hypothetical protein
MADDEIGVVQTLLERLNKFRIPRALELKSRVDAGECLSDYDIEFLQRVFSDAAHARRLVDRHPQLQKLATQLASLYCDIASKALENEQKRLANHRDIQ